MVAAAEEAEEAAEDLGVVADVAGDETAALVELAEVLAVVPVEEATLEAPLTKRR